MEKSTQNSVIRENIESTIASYFTSLRLRAPAEMIDMLEYHFSTGGKRIRALATVLAATHASRAMSTSLEGNAIYPVASAVELLHNATLIHDDIQDGDLVRRGQPTLWQKFSLAQGINAGDYLFFLVTSLVDTASLSVEQKHRLNLLFADSTQSVINGQCQEFVLKQNLRKSNIAESSYLEMVQGKTVALFSLPIQAGLLVAKADQLYTDQVAKMVEHIGIAFQIHDDYLDLWGQKGRELPGRDIAEGKISYPIVLLLQKLESRQAVAKIKQVKEILEKDREQTSEEEVASVMQELEREGIRELIEAKIKESIDKLDLLPTHHALREFFAELREMFFPLVKK